MGVLKVVASAALACCIVAGGKALASDDEEPVVLEQGCTFRSQPDEFTSRESRIRRDVFEQSAKLSGSSKSAAAAVPIARQNLIDDFIFAKLEQKAIAPAALSTDEEFVRRIYLDLTGRLPSPADIKDFVGSAFAGKRNELIEKLLYSPEFIDKWSTWFGDLLQNTERLSTSARAPQVEGRVAFHNFLCDAIANNKSLATIAQETITATGNNYFAENGSANYPVLASTAMGPAQDTYDMMLVRTATAYLGLASYDCVLCHNGRGHLDAVSVWGSRGVRVDAQRMAAHFARMRLTNGAPGAVQYDNVLYNSTNVQEAATGTYDLNTTAGNRPNRTPAGTERNLTPEYRDGSRPPAGVNWRAFYAEKLVNDPLFGKNFANRIWKQMFGLGLVDPVDSLDPDRLDLKNPPPSPWTFQTEHLELLDRLGRFFMENNTDVRALLRLIAQSTAYQLSSRYEGEWKLEYVPFYARHYPRRLDAEEIHDAVVKASGLPNRYTWPVINNQTVTRGSALRQSDPVEWAMKLPDLTEPRTNPGNILTWMRSFQRGNRDTAQRSQAGSILQRLNLMNDAFVTSRIKVQNSPVMKGIVALSDNKEAVDELFLTFLSRWPTSAEREKALAHVAKASTTAARNMAFEDLAWVCVNKIDFVFSY